MDTANEPSELTIRRLAFIKYLYSVAITQSLQPEPLNATALLTFHDSVELFLQLTAEERGIDSKQFSFMDYFKHMKDIKLSAPMRKLNDLRVSLKHHGNLPSRLSTDEFRVRVSQFFEENTPIIFHTSFADISLALLVSHPDIQEKLSDAEKSIDLHQYSQALTAITQAFWLVATIYEEWENKTYGHSMFTFFEPLIPSDSGQEASSANTTKIDNPLELYGSLFSFKTQLELSGFKTEVANRFSSIEDMLRALAMGLDVRRYVRFRLLTSKYVDIIKLESLQQNEPSIAVCQFCFSFVIESALRLQEIELNGGYMV